MASVFVFVHFIWQLLKMSNRKKYVQINNHTSSDQIFALLDHVESDEKEDIEELMNDSDTKLFANDKDIENIAPDSDNADI